MTKFWKLKWHLCYNMLFLILKIIEVYEVIFSTAKYVSQFHPWAKWWTDMCISIHVNCGCINNVHKHIMTWWSCVYQCTVDVSCHVTKPTSGVSPWYQPHPHQPHPWTPGYSDDDKHYSFTVLEISFVAHC